MKMANPFIIRQLDSLCRKGARNIEGKSSLWQRFLVTSLAIPQSNWTIKGEAQLMGLVSKSGSQRLHEKHERKFYI